MKRILVYADWIDLGSPKLMGILNVDSLHGKEVFSFEYDPSWLKTDNIQALNYIIQSY